MENIETSITESFGNSISSNITDACIDTAEVVLDSFLDDGVLKEIPIIKYAATAYRIIDDIKGRFFLHKIKQFINSFNSGLASEEEIKKQQEKFSGKSRDKELAYIMIIVERYMDFEKPALLAKLFLAYLNNAISWDEFCSYAEIIDKILKMDLKYLIENESYTVRNNIVPSELLRLTGVGLMYSYQNDSPFKSNGHGGIAIYADSFDRVTSKERIYQRNAFGQKFVDIIV